jgi:hypothetical protein
VITSRYYPKCTLCKSYHHEWNDSNAVATDAQEPEEEAYDKEPTSVISHQHRRRCSGTTERRGGGNCGAEWIMNPIPLFGKSSAIQENPVSSDTYF